MTVDEVYAELQQVRGQLTDVAQRLDRPTPRPTRDATPQAQAAPVVPYWDFTTATGLTLNNGVSDDWDRRFDAGVDSGLANRVKTGIPCGKGWFTQVDYGSGGQRRWKLSWNARTSRKASCLIQGGLTDAGYVQVKFNGTRSEYYLDSPGADGFEYFTLDVIGGRANHLVICCQGFPDTLEFFGPLINFHAGDTWIQPESCDWYRE